MSYGCEFFGVDLSATYMRAGHLGGYNLVYAQLTRSRTRSHLYVGYNGPHILRQRSGTSPQPNP